MASGMKWLVVVLTGCIAMSAIARKYPALPERHTRTADSLTIEALRIQSALSATDHTLREHARVDSLLPLLPDSPGFVVGLSPALPAVARDSMNELLDREISSIEQPRARTGVFLLDNRYGGHPGVRLRQDRAGRDIYAGVDADGPYCAMVGTGYIGNEGRMFADAFQMVRREQHAGVLGPCRFFARYGAPGARVSQWLDNGGYAFAEIPGPAWPIDVYGAMGRTRDFWSMSDMDVRGCIAGRDELCGEIVAVLPDTARPASAASPARLESAYLYPDNMSRMLLSEMETSFGAERFEQFWTSSDEVPIAFAGAFGVGMAEWLREWGKSHYGRQRLGSGVGAGTTLLSLLIIVVAAAAAAVVATRRRV